jgi:membrane fusion protein
MSVDFRPEVYENKKQTLWGKILLKPDVFYTRATQAITAVLFLFILLIFFGTYATKETVQGVVEPRAGLISIYSPINGVVEEIYHDQGEFVDADEPLLKITAPEVLSGGESYESLMRKTLQEDQENTLAQIENIEKEYQLKQDEAHRQFEEIEIHRDALIKQQPLEEKNYAILKEQYERKKKVFEKGSISQIVLEQAEQELTVAEKNLIRLKLELDQINHRIANKKLTMQQMENQYQEKRNQLQTQLAQVKKALIELTRHTQIVITSSAKGFVTQMPFDVGQTVKAGAHLCDIMKEGDQYWIKLLVPSSSIGFIQEGQSVSLRIESYPHQHYGSLKARIARVTQSIYQGPVANNGQIYYIVYVEPDRQSIKTDGSLPLKLGMGVQADIKTQEMTFFQKIFEPLYRSTLTS